MRLTATVFTLGAVVLACAKSQNPQPTPPARALQRFYDAYLPAFERGSSRALLEDSTTILAPALRQALIADYQAATADSTQIVGLDFDPFLNSQDPCSAYRVGADSAQGVRHLVQVRAICPTDTALAVIAVLEPVGENWSLVDLRYPGDTGTLLGILARLAQDRGKPAGAQPPP